MDPVIGIELLGRCASGRRVQALLLQIEPKHELGARFFDRVAELAGENPSRAIRLARHWAEIADVSRQPDFAYRAKAVGERLAGKWAESAQSFIRAGLLSPDPVRKLSFQAGAVDSLARAGDVAEAVKLGKKLAAGLERMGQTSLSARVKLNIANALVWSDSYRRACQWFSASIPDLQDGGFELEAAAARLGQSTAELYGARPDAAADLARKALAYFQANGMSYYADLCSLNLAQASILLGRPDEAMLMLIDLKERLAAWPVERSTVEEYLGDAYVRLNLYEEAIASYSSAARHLRDRDMPRARAHCLYGLSQAHLRKGEAALAAREFARAAKAYKALGNSVWNAAARLGRACALRELGRTRVAKGEASSCVEDLRRLNSPYHLVNGLLELARCSPQDAACSASWALRLIRSHGFVGQEWEVHAIRAQVATKEQRLPHYRAGFKAIVSGRMLNRSDAGRTRYLRDKGEFFEGYMNQLLEAPSARSVEEALSAILESRSAALIDEVLSARGDSFDDADTGRLQDLRRELAVLSGTSVLRNGETPATENSAQDVSRRWLERSARAMSAAVTPRHDTPKATISVYVQAGQNLYHIEGHTAARLGLSAGNLRQKLKWLEFEIAAPTVDPDAGDGCAISMLAELSRDLGSPVMLSPDGALWDVPWQGIATMNGGPEPALLPSPAFGLDAASERLPENPKVGIWYLKSDLLPQIEAEVKLLMKLFPNAEVMCARSEIDRCLNGGSYDLLHVAGHASFNSANPMFSFLEIEGGKVFAAEIAQSRLSSKLVVLSACQTGNMGFVSKEEPEGLIRAFLARSASAVIGSSWAVHDESARRFMDGLYRNLRANHSLSHSMRAGRNACRNWKEHPYYWAPFVLFGGYTG